MSLKQLVNNPFIRFILFASLLCVLWYALYLGYINPETNLDRFVIDSLISITRTILSFLGYDLIPVPAAAAQIRTVGIDGTLGLWIGDPCNGLNLFALFSIFIACYPGKWKNKLWFIPLGILSIHLINVIRIVALCIIVSIDYAYLDFQHDYTFTVIVYGFMFLLWIWWANRFSGMNRKEINKTAFDK
ncbi:MAG: exosortase family protein XrtF [Patiriisocius sp.]|jgi:exosortase family protein XrtF